MAGKEEHSHCEYPISSNSLVTCSNGIHITPHTALCCGVQYITEELYQSNGFITHVLWFFIIIKEGQKM